MRRNKALLCAEITTLREQGLPKRVIAERLGIGTTTVDRYVAMFQIPMGRRAIICPHCNMDIRAPRGAS